jgi:hypothetical protein
VKRISAFTAAFALASVQLVAQEPVAPAAAIPQTVTQAPETEASKVNVVPSIVLPAGTEIKLLFAQTLSSKHVTTGEKLELRVAEEVKVGDTVVIPKGCRAIGVVTHGKKNEKYGNSKELAIRVDYIVAGKKRVKLTGEKRQKPKTNAGSATAATVALGLAGLMFYLGEREAWIREGSEVVGYSAEDVTFPAPEPKSEVVSE